MRWRTSPMANSFDVQIIPKDNSIRDIFIQCRTDICPFCKAQRIELISFNGYPQNYRDAVNEYIKGFGRTIYKAKRDLEEKYKNTIY